jgi:ribosomal protein S18 acetylase RimI-like enzyme
MPDEEPPLKRESAGRYRTRDERFAVEQNSGRWLVLDTEQTDELGLPLVRGPFSTLDDAREAIAAARTGPAPTSPLARRAKAAPPRKATERSGSRAPKAGTVAKRMTPEPEPQPEPAPPPLVIRRLEPGDGPVLRRLAEEAGAFEAGGGTRRSTTVSDQAALDAQAARRVLADPDVYLLVAFEADVPVGFLVAHELLRPFGDPVRLFVREVRVRAERRREGIGRRLLESLWAIGREHGVGSAFALADPDDRDALAFYRAAGGKRSRRDLVVIRFGTEAE